MNAIIKICSLVGVSQEFSPGIGKLGNLFGNVIMKRDEKYRVWDDAKSAPKELGEHFVGRISDCFEEADQAKRWRILFGTRRIHKKSSKILERLIADFSKKANISEKSFCNSCCFYDFLDDLKITSLKSSIVLSEGCNALFWDIKEGKAYASWHEGGIYLLKQYHIKVYNQ
jgi:hypothetical protein